MNGEQHDRHLTHCVHLTSAAQHLRFLSHFPINIVHFHFCSTHLMSKVVGLPDCGQDQRCEECWCHLDCKFYFQSVSRLTNLHHRMFHWASKYVADPNKIYTFSQFSPSQPVDIVAHSWNEPGKVGQVFPIWIAHRADAHSITVCSLVTLRKIIK